MANSEQLAEPSLCLNCCICCLKTVLLTSQWTLFCRWWLGSSVLSWVSDSVSSPCISPLRGHTVASSLSGAWNTSTRGREGHRMLFFLCVIWNISAACVCTECTKLPSTPFFFRSAVSTGLLLFPLISSVTDLSVFQFLEPCALRSVHWSTKQIEQMFLTLCVMPRPQILSVGYAVRG